MSDDERFDDGVDSQVIVPVADDEGNDGMVLYLMKNGTVRWKIED